MYLVLFETSGNQGYIFATNKLRENIGASELTFRVGTQFVLEAIRELGGPIICASDSDRRRSDLLDSAVNPCLETGTNPIEVVVATSGKAILLAKDEAVAKLLITKVTELTLREAPGLTVHGVFGKSFDIDQVDANCVKQLVEEVYHRLEEVRFSLPGPDQRFLRLPVVAPCKTSGLPASVYDDLDPISDEHAERSAVALAKRQASEDGKERLKELIERKTGYIYSFKSTNELEKKLRELDWVAVIHADGNGLGQVFLKFEKFIGEPAAGCSFGRHYFDTLRRFSLSLDIALEEAFSFAVKELARRDLSYRLKTNRKADKDKLYVPLVPLVLGGDDLTVLCDGEHALQFTRDFVRHYEQTTKGEGFEETRQDLARIVKTTLPAIVRDAFPKPVQGLSICAGVAIVKPHFPFHAAYELAESLLQSAKTVKTKVVVPEKIRVVPCSTLDYHVLYDSSNVELKRIRDELTITKKGNVESFLFARPYVISSNSEDFGITDESKQWINLRRWNDLETRVRAMRVSDEQDPSRRKLPTGMLHMLRESLFEGVDHAEAQLELIKHRYLEEGIEKVLWSDKKTLFCQLDFNQKQPGSDLEQPPDSDPKQSKQPKQPSITGFLDALEIVEFWQDDNHTGGTPNDKAN
ncbi:MAG: hypothetical protein HY774_28845 [Acidobacteria bacterium]|nr:hypothetical protein [Acidobacteriota bacterium]